MNYETKTSLILAIAWMLIFTILMLTSWIGCSYFEARSYNKLTGKNVSTWDAMFLELRVQEPVQ